MQLTNRWFRRLSWYCLCGVVLYAASELRLQATDFREIRGRLDRCVVAESGTALDLFVSSAQMVHIDLPSQAIQWPSVEYQRLVGTQYRQETSCPAIGEQLRVTTCEGCPPPVLAVETGGGGTSFDETKRRLWAFRQFLDRSAGNETEYANLIGVSMILAKYNRDDGGSRTFWLRARLSFALDAYSSLARASVMDERFGRPSLPTAQNGQLVDLYRRFQQEIGLVQGLPFQPANPRSAPFVGAWGSFATEVYVQRGDGSLAKVFPVERGAAR